MATNGTFWTFIGERSSSEQVTDLGRVAELFASDITPHQLVTAIGINGVRRREAR